MVKVSKRRKMNQIKRNEGKAGLRKNRKGLKEVRETFIDLSATIRKDVFPPFSNQD